MFTVRMRFFVALIAIAGLAAIVVFGLAPRFGSTDRAAPGDGAATSRSSANPSTPASAPLASAEEIAATDEAAGDETTQERREPWLRLSGFVRDADSGAPIAGARVRTWSDADRPAVTDSNGAYAVELVDPWTVLTQVIVRVPGSPGYQRTRWNVPAPVEGAPASATTHDFAMIRDALHGELTVTAHHADGAPAVDAVVAVSLRVHALDGVPANAWPPAHLLAYCDALDDTIAEEDVVAREDAPGPDRLDRLDKRGSARFTLAVPGRYSVRVSTVDATALADVDVAGVPRTLDLVLAPGVAPRVRVICAGAPSVGVRVDLFRGERGVQSVSESANTGDDGVAQFRALPPGTRCVIHASLPGSFKQCGVVIPATPMAEPFVLELRSERKLDLQVVDARTGRGLSGVIVGIGFDRFESCDDDGRFDGVVEMTDDDVLSIYRWGFEPRRLAAPSVANQPQVVVPLDRPPSGSTRVRFRTVDATGAPVAGRTIEAGALVFGADGFSLMSLSVDTRESGQDGICGEVSAALANDERLEVYCELESDASPPVLGRSECVACGDDRTIDIAVGGAPVRGRVLLLGGASPPDSVEVEVAAPVDPTTRATERPAPRVASKCDASGKFETSAPVGPIVITARWRSFAATRRVVVPPGGLADVLLDLAPAREVRVTCVDAVTGAPLAFPVFSMKFARDDGMTRLFRVARGEDLATYVRALGHEPATLFVPGAMESTEVVLRMTPIR